MNKTRLVSVPEYFQLIQKENLTEEENIQIRQFENFITTAIQYEDKASEALKSVIEMYRAQIRVLYYTGKEEIAENLESKIESRLPNNENIRSLKPLPKAGFVSSAIILIVLLNLGFIIAMTIIGG